MVVLKELDFVTVCTLGGWVVLKELICNSFSLGGCGGLERTNFEQFLIWEVLMVLKVCTLWEGVVVLKEWGIQHFL